MPETSNTCVASLVQLDNDELYKGLSHCECVPRGTQSPTTAAVIAPEGDGDLSGDERGAKRRSDGGEGTEQAAKRQKQDQLKAGCPCTHSSNQQLNYQVAWFVIS